MENNTQYFTKEQTDLVSRHIRQVYENSRYDAKKNFLKSDEGKALLKEINESDFAKELNSDREVLLKEYDNLFKIYTSLKTVIGVTSAKSTIRLLNDPASHIKEDSVRWSNIKISPIEKQEIKHLYSGGAIDAIKEDLDREEFNTNLGNIISERIRRKAKNRMHYSIDMWDNGRNIDAIVATMPACDETQAVEKVVKKLPYETVNKVEIRDEDYNEYNDDAIEEVKSSE